jgi:hypothetical protein
MLLAASRSFRPGEEGTVKLGVYDNSVVGLRRIREDCLLRTAYFSGLGYVDECDWKRIQRNCATRIERLRSVDRFACACLVRSVCNMTWRYAYGMEEVMSLAACAIFHQPRPTAPLCISGALDAQRHALAIQVAEAPASVIHDGLHEMSGTGCSTLQQTQSHISFFRPC